MDQASSIYPIVQILMRNYRRIFFSVHSWLGLVAGLFILSFFLTGSIIVFRKELNKWQYPHLQKIEKPGNQYLSYNQLFHLTKKKVPDLHIYSFRYIPVQADETIEMRVFDHVKKSYGLLYLNPYNGEILGTTWNDSLYDILLTMHFTFFMGKLGELLAGIFAFALLGSVLTGIFVYRKHLIKVFTFQQRMKWKDWRSISSSLHRSVGVWALLFNLIISISGFYMMLYAFDLKQQFGSNASTSVLEPPEIKPDIDSLIHQAESLLEPGRFQYLDFPRNEGEPITVYTDGGYWLWGNFNNKVEFNAQTGAITRIFHQSEMTGKEKMEYALYTLHYGQYGGGIIKCVYAAMGLAGAVLSISGFALYLRRKQRNQ
jgi:uncharacterized iron-regulated membrane protein